MPAYLTFHVEPERRWEDLVEKYRVLARETTAVWIPTYLAEDGSQRICQWDAPSPETLHVIFARTGISCDRIAAVREVLPSQWRQAGHPCREGGEPSGGGREEEDAQGREGEG